VTKMLVTPREAAEALGVSIHTLRRAIREGRVPAVRPLAGRSVRVRVADVMRLAEAEPTSDRPFATSYWVCPLHRAPGHPVRTSPASTRAGTRSSTIR
jgi:excisionase family DNA binding protein